jgi:hypothetical protein
MTAPEGPDDPLFRDALQGLRRGDFSRLEPLFAEGRPCRIVRWYGEGYFGGEPAALAGALACACFLGRTEVARFLLDQGVDPGAGAGTGLNGFHWAANRGHLETVELLIGRDAPLEARSMYGGTVLGAAVWSAVHEPRADHPAIIAALIRAGARLDGAGYPTDNGRVDDLLRRLGAGA